MEFDDTFLSNSKENNFPMYLNIGYSPDASKHIYSRSGYQSEDLSGYEIIFFISFLISPEINEFLVIILDRNISGFIKDAFYLSLFK